LIDKFLSDEAKYQSQVWAQKSWWGRTLCSALSTTEATPASLTIVCYHTTTVWHGGLLPEGVGGSEQAAVHLAEAFVALGWHVTVYNNCGPSKLSIHGVEYRPSWMFNHRSRHDVVVLWRTNRLCEGSRVNCRVLAHWLHDVPDRQDFTGDRVERTDKLLVLSKSHRLLLPQVSEERVAISSNGVRQSAIRVDMLDEKIRRKAGSKKCIYTSAPDRGLECLLMLWPRIYARCPQATLSVFYGWKNWSTSRARHPSDVNWLNKMQMLLRQDGIVTANEFVTEEELWAEYLAADVWLYPTEAVETSCITAMKAQVAGAVPVTTTCGALEETVQWGVKLANERIYSDEQAQNRFVEAAVEVLTNGYVDREKMSLWARQEFSWTNVASNWAVLFGQGH
jgi:glycosyltransferase involved in cell wall biosynthesis